MSKDTKHTPQAPAQKGVRPSPPPAPPPSSGGRKEQGGVFKTPPAPRQRKNRPAVASRPLLIGLSESLVLHESKG
jgi:hypothetical protein